MMAVSAKEIFGAACQMQIVEPLNSDKSEAADSDLFAKDPPTWARDKFNGGYGEQCGDCGAWCEVVRPGKTQCRNPDCEVDG
jgi:hypothetical protein